MTGRQKCLSHRAIIYNYTTTGETMTSARGLFFRLWQGRFMPRHKSVDKIAAVRQYAIRKE